jgi:hypothetical protein
MWIHLKTTRSDPIRPLIPIEFGRPFRRQLGSSVAPKAPVKVGKG